jgi:hypothetical protein
VGTSTASTLSDIEATRARLERDIQALVDRMPAPAVWVKRLVGLALGGGVSGGVFWFVVHRLRNRARKRKEAKAKAEAASEAAQATLSPVIQVLPSRWSEGLADLAASDRWKAPVAILVGIWIMLRLAELRRLRALTKALTTTPAASREPAPR